MWRIGVDLGGTKIEALALSPGGEERTRIRVPTPRGDYDATLDAIVSLAGDLPRRFGGPGHRRDWHRHSRQPLAQDGAGAQCELHLA